jgi:uncharacterized protein (DUF433 family)
MQHPLNMPGVFSDPEIHGGQPVVESGIPIYLILDMLAQGFPPEEMRQDYGITDEQVRIALRFAAEWMKREGSDAA